MCVCIYLHNTYSTYVCVCIVHQLIKQNNFKFYSERDNETIVKF